MAGLVVPSRRTLLKGLGATAGLSMAAPALAKAVAAPVWKGNPFSLGVAAGAPLPDGFVLWTRLAPSPYEPGFGMAGPSRAIGYEIAEDDAMHRIVQRGTALADADFGYSAHKVIRGLKAGRPYWYRFTSGAAASSVGRAMTLPGRHLDKLRFAYFSCSDYEHGFFSAYRHAAEENPDFGIFLGDYIYEYIEKKHPIVRTHSGGKECVTLDDYRARYTQYRLDPNLQFLHASLPAVLTWDDHEVQNDYAGQWGEDFQDSADFLKRRAAAYRAFYEFMPVKPGYSQPHGPDMRLYDRYDFGDLLRVDLIDGRQYRSRQACYEDRRKKGLSAGGHVETPESCPELMDPSRSMIGMAQEKWLFAGLATSKARWNVIANDVILARLHQGGADNYYTDGWDGFPPSRQRLLDHIARSKPSNPVAITGDIHSFWANGIKADFANDKSPVIATELIGTSISSYGLPYDTVAKMLPDNLHVKFFESRQRGYVSVDLTRQAMTAKFQVVSDVTDPNATLSTLKTFVVEDGKPGPVAA